MNLDLELEAAKNGSESACFLMMEHYRSSFSVYDKGGSNNRAETILTEPDILCDRALQSHFKSLFPGHTIVSEESVDKLSGGWFRNEWIWYIDPIDGSLGYLEGTDNFGVSISLAHRNQPVLGLIRNPARKLEAFSTKGQGAFLNGEQVSFDFQAHWPPRLILSKRQSQQTSYRRIIDIMKPEEITLRESVVTKALLLLRGEGDIYFSLPQEIFGWGAPNLWDIAGAAAVIREAGGVAVDIYGQPLTFDPPELKWRRGFIFCHPDIFDSAFHILSTITKKRKSGVRPKDLKLD